MARYGDAHTSFNDTPIVAGGMSAGFAIGAAMMQGVMNYRRKLEEQRHVDAAVELESLRAYSHAVDVYADLRINAEIEKNVAQALVNEALRVENDRLRGL